MEYLDGGTNPWNLQSPHTPIPAILHPSTCCLCAISDGSIGEEDVSETKHSSLSPEERQNPLPDLELSNLVESISKITENCSEVDNSNGSSSDHVCVLNSEEKKSGNDNTSSPSMEIALGSDNIDGTNYKSTILDSANISFETKMPEVYLIFQDESLTLENLPDEEKMYVHNEFNPSESTVSKEKENQQSEDNLDASCKEMQGQMNINYENVTILNDEYSHLTEGPLKENFYQADNWAYFEEFRLEEDTERSNSHVKMEDTVDNFMANDLEELAFTDQSDPDSNDQEKWDHSIDHLNDDIGNERCLNICKIQHKDDEVELNATDESISSVNPENGNGNYSYLQVEVDENSYNLPCLERTVAGLSMEEYFDNESDNYECQSEDCSDTANDCYERSSEDIILKDKSTQTQQYNKELNSGVTSSYFCSSLYEYQNNVIYLHDESQLLQYNREYHSQSLPSLLLAENELYSPLVKKAMSSLHVCSENVPKVLYGSENLASKRSVSAAEYRDNCESPLPEVKTDQLSSDSSFIQTNNPSENGWANNQTITAHEYACLSIQNKGRENEQSLDSNIFEQSHDKFAVSIVDSSICPPHQKLLLKEKATENNNEQDVEGCMSFQYPEQIFHSDNELRISCESSGNLSDDKTGDRVQCDIAHYPSDESFNLPKTSTIDECSVRDLIISSHLSNDNENGSLGTVIENASDNENNEEVSTEVLVIDDAEIIKPALCSFENSISKKELPEVCGHDGDTHNLVNETAQLALPLNIVNLEDPSNVRADSESPLSTITEEREDWFAGYIKNGTLFSARLDFDFPQLFCAMNEEVLRFANETFDGLEMGNMESAKTNPDLAVSDDDGNIPDILLFMHNDEKEEVTSAEAESRENCIVMMNEDESFVTVVQESCVPHETAVDLQDAVDCVPIGVVEVKSDSSVAIVNKCDAQEENPEPDYQNSTLRRKFLKFERRLSNISFNKFMFSTSTRAKETAPDAPKPKRPLSGVRRKLANSRRRSYNTISGCRPSSSSGNTPSPLFPPFLRDLKEKRRASVHEEALFTREKGGCYKRCLSQREEFLFGFGKRAQGGGRRPNECLILEPSEMMVIDYPDVQLMHPGSRASVNQRAMDKYHLTLDHRELPLRGAGSLNSPLGSLADGGVPNYHNHPHLHQLHHELPDLLRGGRSRGSVGSSVRDGSDTSSAYSGSDTMCQSIHSLDHEDVDLSGLMESVVDSDEEDLVENIENMSVQDTVRECLEKDPSDRTEQDIKVLLEFTERLSAFSNMTVGVRRAMCQAMVFAVVEEADTVLMNDREELDSWSVIINGHVEITHSDGGLEKLHLGDSFGITPTMEKMFHRGVMRSKVDDCQFVCIRQSDYYRILRQGEENTRRLEEDGITVLVTEKSHIDSCQREANIVIKGTPERLMLHLVEVENVLDPTYVEDFLLMHRKFIESPIFVMRKLLEWFEDPKYQDIVTRVILRWVQSHFTDFEMDPDMMAFLEQFEEGLQRKEMTGQLLFLRVVCMTKARSRLVTLLRPSRETPLQFVIQGGRNHGIFIAQVESGSKAQEAGLKRADQILEVNGQNFQNISKARALEILTSSCHIAITVRSNLHVYNDMLQTPENSHKSKSRKISDITGNGNCHGSLDFASSLNLNTVQLPLVNSRKEGKGSSMTLKTHKFKEFLSSIVNKNTIIDTPVCSDDSVSSHSSAGGGHLFRSRSNPDLSSTDYEDSSRSEFPEHVLKVYRATDQSTRFLPVHKETTSREVVMLSLRLFQLTEPSKNYALYEVSVTEQGVVKQKRLPDALQNLAERIGLNSRYYLKSVTSTQPLCPDEVIQDLIREWQVSILQLNSVVELAIQLTLENFAIFRQIEPTEYVDDLFKIDSKYGIPALSKFEEISNKELYWVCTEVCSERNMYKRAKIIKQFIKISKYCKDLNNFNSMFAVLSGLGSTSVNRLRQTWAKVPNRYVKIFQDLENIMNPSQNMKNYRTLASSASSQSPMIPFYPIVKKDLLFLNEGNDDEVDGLINFEKLRTISKSIRKLGEMCSAKYFPNKMLEKLGQPLSTAMSAMNQSITGSQQSSTVKRRKKSTAQPDKKKMFEEAQTVRRVKAYLNQLKVIKDEDRLLKMSYECEPPSSSHSIGGMGSSINATLGSASSTSSSVSQRNTNGTVSQKNTNGTLSQKNTNGTVSAPRRRPDSPTPSTTSSASSTSLTSEGKKAHARFGAASPSSEKKMLSLAEATKKPYHGPRPTTSSSQGSLSPNPSPGVLRRGPVPPIPVPAPYPPSTVRMNHERSQSDTPVSSVDLNVESSSVTSLSSLANLRKSLTAGSMAADFLGNHGETDSGISTHFDCHSSSSLEVGGGVTFEGHYPPSPPHLRRFSHQPAGSTFKPSYSFAVPAMPSSSIEVCGGRVMRRGVGACPPDYTSTQIRIQQLGRALSHDSVPYYHHTRHQADDEEDAQVSAV